MNFNRSEDRDEDLEINFIPLIDVLLVIIILVVSTTFSKIHELEIKLPVAQANPLDKKMNP
jgi:Biopolymer transport protein